MKWPGFLSRARHPQIPVAAADPSPAPVGMDYLRARSGLGDIVHEPATPWLDDDAGEAAAAAPVPPEPSLTCEMMIERAELASARREWSDAERIWRAVRASLPDHWGAYISGATALIELDRHDEARDLLSDAAVLFPWERAVVLELGRLAMARSDWPAAEAHWRTALTFDVRPWWVYSELAGSLDEQGRFTEAETVLFEGQARADEPDEITLHTYPARLAWKRNDWATAVARWAEARRKFPDVEELPARHHEALMLLAEHDPVAYLAALGDAAPEAASDDEAQALALRFESLGGTGPDGGCEFGCFQRSLGAEPLGLFRWAAVSAASLIACLDARFARIGDADSISIAPHEGQWEITDTIYGTKMHSFVSSTDVPAERMLAMAGKRMRYLRQKLIADLESPTKIFVLKAAWQTVTAAEIAALAQALRSYGQGELLCVCQADATLPEGKVQAAVPGVFLGYLDFAGQLDVAARRPAWKALCRTMLGLSNLPMATRSLEMADSATG